MENGNYELCLNVSILPLEEFESRLLEFIGDKEKQSSFAHQPMATRELLLSQEAPTLEFSINIQRNEPDACISIRRLPPHLYEDQGRNFFTYSR